MRVPTSLSLAFGPEFQELIADFAQSRGLLDSADDLKSRRFLARSIAPHVTRLSAMFNRTAELKALAAAEIAAKSGSGGRPGRKADAVRNPAVRNPAVQDPPVQDPPDLSLDPYWKRTSNPDHLRLAYFLTFMPSNLYRVASVWSELARLGYRWRAGNRLRALELGAGPAAGACGVAAGERFAPIGLPPQGDWALIEQDRATLDLGARWAERYFAWSAEQRTPTAVAGAGANADAEASAGGGADADVEEVETANTPEPADPDPEVEKVETGNLATRDWGLRPFHRKLALDQLLPAAAPKFNLWVMSYFLNEFPNPPAEIAEALLAAWERHLDDEGLVIIVEPALRLISRRLLELRRELLAQDRKHRFRVLLPCLGHQACGALADPEDWCHEEVSWWRPPYLRKIDELTELDRKSLPFSYLVIARTRRELPDLLPALGGGENRFHRLVSPAHAEGKEREFFVCGAEGKRRARLKPDSKDDPAADIGRGDILIDADLRGSPQSTRVERYRTLKQ